MWDNFQSFMAKPFDADDNNMSALDWFLFIGFLMLVVAIWVMIFKHIEV